MLVWCVLTRRHSLMAGYSVLQNHDDIEESVVVRTASRCSPTDTDHIELH